MYSLMHLHYVDTIILEFFFTRHTPLFDVVFSTITLLGNTEIVIGIAICFSIFLYVIKNYRYSLLVVIVVVGSTFSTYLLKLFFVRPRPDLLLHQLESYSFPSGHATGAIALCGIIAFTLLKYTENNTARWHIIALAVLTIVAIGFSRIYLGHHYVGDVLAGYLVGALWLLIGIRYSKST